MNNNKKYFKGFGCYELHQDETGNIKLNNYNDVINARRAKVDMLLDNIQPDNVDFINLDKALSEKFIDNQVLYKVNEEDQEIAQEKIKLFSVLNHLDDLSSIESQDLLQVSLLLSNLSYVERNIVLNSDQDSKLYGLKELFFEKKVSGEDYTNDEYQDLADYVDRVNNIIKLELESRIEGEK